MTWRNRVETVYVVIISHSLLFSSSLSFWEGGNAAKDRWDLVIATDPFLYESWHSLPHGTAGFLEGGNGFFSCCSLRWAECKLHPAWPLLKARPESSRNSLPSSSPLRPGETFPSSSERGIRKRGSLLFILKLK